MKRNSHSSSYIFKNNGTYAHYTGGAKDADGKYIILNVFATGFQNTRDTPDNN